jgi:ADP-dependent phosphofructokinase/glucokinase
VLKLIILHFVAHLLYTLSLKKGEAAEIPLRDV